LQFTVRETWIQAKNKGKDTHVSTGYGFHHSNSVGVPHKAMVVPELDPAQKQQDLGRKPLPACRP
jgi:hypothetical protein